MYMCEIDHQFSSLKPVRSGAGALGWQEWDGEGVGVMVWIEHMYTHG